MFHFINTFKFLLLFHILPLYSLAFEMPEFGTVKLQTRLEPLTHTTVACYVVTEMKIFLLM